MKRVCDQHAPISIHLDDDCLYVIFTYVADRGVICSVSSQWHLVAIKNTQDAIAREIHYANSKSRPPRCIAWNGKPPTTPVYSDIDITMDMAPSPYSSLHLTKRTVSNPCIYRACASGNYNVISSILRLVDTGCTFLCKHNDCLAIFGDDNASSILHIDYQICFELVCTHGSLRAIMEIANKIFTTIDDNAKPQLILAGLRRACYNGNLLAVRLLMRSLPPSHHRDAMECATYAYEHTRIIMHICKNVTPGVITRDAIRDIARQMAKCRTTDNIAWLKKSFPNQSHEIDASFWVSCGIHGTHVDNAEPVQMYGIALGAIQMDNLDIFIRVTTSHKPLSHFFMHCAERDSINIAKYIMEQEPITTTMLNRALSAACGFYITDCAEYFAANGATSCNCGRDMNYHISNDERVHLQEAFYDMLAEIAG